MAGKKGMKHYSSELREEVKAEYAKGHSVKGLSRKYGISRYAIQGWCGLRPEVNARQNAPKRRGRPRQRPLTSEERIKELEREVTLLRSFLYAAGRR